MRRSGAEQVCSKDEVKRQFGGLTYQVHAHKMKSHPSHYLQAQS